MNRRLRASTNSFSTSPNRTEPFHKYLKPGALAQIRDSRISARTHRVNSSFHSLYASFQISLHRATPPSSPTANAGSQQQSPVNAIDGMPCFAGRIYGPRCPQRKRLAAAKSVLFLSPSPVPESPDQVVDAFSSDILVAH